MFKQESRLTPNRDHSGCLEEHRSGRTEEYLLFFGLMRAWEGLKAFLERAL